MEIGSRLTFGWKMQEDLQLEVRRIKISVGGVEGERAGGGDEGLRARVGDLGLAALLTPYLYVAQSAAYARSLKKQRSVKKPRSIDRVGTRREKTRLAPPDHVPRRRKPPGLPAFPRHRKTPRRRATTATPRPADPCAFLVPIPLPHSLSHCNGGWRH